MKLKDYLKKNDLRPSDLAEATDIPLPTIISYVSENHEPSLKNALKIQKATLGAIKLEDMVLERK
jgi:hypothetical protein